MAMVAGHSHPVVLERIREQVELLMQNSIRVLNIPRVLLAKKLSEIVPDPLAMSFFLSTGSESVEAALRLAKKYTGRFEVVALLRGYHGRTAGSQAYTSLSRGARAGYGPFIPGATFIPAPYCYRCAFNETLPCNLSCLSYAEDVIDRTTSGQPAAMLIEIMQGVGGTIVPPVGWVKRLRRICNERDMLLIIDESLTGMGARLKNGLEELQTKFEVLGDVRGKGLFLGIEIIESKASKRPDPARALELVTDCEDRGLLLGGGIPTGGLGTNTIRLCPPLVITEEQVTAALDIMEDVLSEI